MLTGYEKIRACQLKCVPITAYSRSFPQAVGRSARSSEKKTHPQPDASDAADSLTGRIILITAAAAYSKRMVAGAQLLWLLQAAQSIETGKALAK
jgi:hypothetical protein